MMETARWVRGVMGSVRRGLATLLVLSVTCLLLPSATAAQAETKPPKARGSQRQPAAKKPVLVDAPMKLAENPVGPDQLAIAQQVERGTVSCELGMRVTVTEDLKLPGHFDVQANKYKFRMTPVVTSTGAIRLEDPQAGAVWLQLPNKSMLMSQKLGARLADACVTPTQAQMAMALEKNPPPALLDASPALPTPVLAARNVTQ